MGWKFETERLVLTEATEDDVDGLLRVALPNPKFTGDHEGSGGVTVQQLPGPVLLCQGERWLREALKTSRAL